MKKSVLFLIGIFLFVCTSNTLAQQPLSQQKLPQPVQMTTDKGKIDSFLKALQGAKSLKEVQTAFTQAQFSKAEVTELQRQIESSLTLKKKLEDLSNQEIAAAKIEIDKKYTLEAKQMEMAKAQFNQKLMTAQQASVTKMMQSAAAIGADPEVRCQADAPSIREVSEIMPGMQFVIRGMGLGRDAGTVDVWTGGLKFPAFINTWNSCQVLAQLSSNIAGVRPDNQAAVDLKTSAGREVRHFTKFTPLMEIMLYREWGRSIFGWFWGASRDYTFWYNRVLRNDWYVLTTGLVHHGQGHAEITHAPPINTPNCSTRTNAHAGVGAFGAVGLMVYQRIAGPKGLSPD